MSGAEIVVGFTDSPAEESAPRWAADQARTPRAAAQTRGPSDRQVPQPEVIA